MSDKNLRLESILVEAGRPAHAPGAPVNEAISASATFQSGGDRAYGREGNPTVDAFETALGAVEGGHAVAFASGVAATTSLVDWLPSGSVLVLPNSFYNYHRTIFDRFVALGRISLRVVDTSRTDHVLAALPGAAMLWLEIPTNPLLKVADLPTLTEAARRHGVLTAVDSTVATPLGLRPLEHGADFVMHSATKWIAGHSDVIMGAIVARTEESGVEVHERRTLTGALPGSLETFLALRGLRTLSVRLERACANTAVLAHRLREHPHVTSVNYLGFPDHPDAAHIEALLHHRGALLSFTTDTVERAVAACGSVRVIQHATSLGGVESLMEHRGRYPGEAAQGTAAELVRLSVGIEHVEDLWTDLNHALA
jgi:cystathionine gamma-synthase